MCPARHVCTHKLVLNERPYKGLVSTRFSSLKASHMCRRTLGKEGGSQRVFI